MANNSHATKGQYIDTITEWRAHSSQTAKWCRLHAEQICSSFGEAHMIDALWALASHHPGRQKLCPP